MTQAASRDKVRVPCALRSRCVNFDIETPGGPGREGTSGIPTRPQRGKDSWGLVTC